ncbi:Endo-beta-glucanase [Lasiodiplodia theobromae]|uniref:Endo-beta-glucanase n=1 Tax=Lasiodiplodia theobromae TaxID=45133 RepID=UPI0015C38BE1|nr:Endo-beta-glucanase [Lasiodiplodia theobromae]KAF4537088.1 Endo-beta-glucanase [Lasiodiplodia theobromae]
MRFSSFIASSAFVGSSIAGYAIKDDYSADNFFSMFNFFTGADPTNGFVDYVDSDTANSSSLIDTSNGKVYMGVDYSSTSSSGRSSVRISSTAAYNEGLVILDLEHFPGGICGTWPAFWMLGDGDWPAGGEIDIIEGTNSQVANQMTLHTAQGCSIASTGAMAGSVSSTNCYAYATDDNEGCAVKDSEANTYSTFNQNNGGVFATELDPTNNKIQVWYFDRSSIPSDITNGSPDPTSWGNPRALFQGGCEVSSHFKNMNIILDTTFCGDWAGNAWSSDETCSAKASTCEDYVQNNPEAFKDAYWSINSLKVYSNDGSTGSSSSAGGYGSTTPIVGRTTSVEPVASTPYGYTPAGNQPLTPAAPYPAGNQSNYYPTGSIGNSVRSKTTVYVTVTPEEAPTPASTPTAAAANAADWQPGEPIPYSFFQNGRGTTVETGAPNKVAHMMEHKKRAHGAWKK